MNQPSNPTYKEAHRWASSFLNSADLDEDIAYHFLLDLADLTTGSWLMRQNKPMPSGEWEQYQAGLQRIVNDHYPWQYLAGQAWFYGYCFKVTEATLIPRQETEELVGEIIQRIKSGEIPADAHLVDIGTGSGAIAITLKLLVPSLQVTATDISAAALAVAQENAAQLQADVTFKLGDLYEPLAGQTFDVIVSNPPYIGDAEIAAMGLDVIKYEPHLALFAADSGYALYWRLLADLPVYLRPCGWFFAEFGYLQGAALKAVFQEKLLYSTVTVKQDYTGLDRMLIVHYLRGDESWKR